MRGRIEIGSGKGGSGMSCTAMPGEVEEEEGATVETGSGVPGDMGLVLEEVSVTEQEESRREITR